MKFKIRYTDTMTTYLLAGTFNTEEDAQDYIDYSSECQPYPSNFFEVEIKEKNNGD